MVGLGVGKRMWVGVFVGVGEGVLVGEGGVLEDRVGEGVGEKELEGIGMVGLLVGLGAVGKGGVGDAGVGETVGGTARGQRI